MATVESAARVEAVPPPAVAVDPALASGPSPPAAPAPKDVVEEKAVIPVSHEKVDDSKAVQSKYTLKRMYVCIYIYVQD